MIDNLISKLKTYWAAISVVAIGILWTLLKSKSQQLETLKGKIKVDKLKDKVQDATKQADQSKQSYDNARAEYDALKRANPDLFGGSDPK